MRTLVQAVLVSVLLLIGPVGYAQESPERGPATEDPNANSSTPRAFQGCVIRANGKVTLVDARNHDYILVSSGHPLDSYVGQEVQVTAVNTNPSDASSDEHGMAAGQAPTQPMTLDVEDIHKIADKCTSPSTTDQKK